MARSSPIRYGVITTGKGQYAVYPELGSKNDGKIVLFPPLNVPINDVLGFFDSAAEANLWVATQLLNQVQRELEEEKAKHATTRARAQALLALLETFKETF